MGLEPILILLLGVEIVEDDVKLSARKGRGESYAGFWVTEPGDRRLVVGVVV
ncbi:putative cupin superfamily protein [Bradyrhizobium elkanii]|nr:putative cupin superfamily protein [Bradyrhizobium elkanii]MCW2153785.1 putative cupin superfamily protein [Bradyrhizobium elkanii]